MANDDDEVMEVEGDDDAILPEGEESMEGDADEDEEEEEDDETPESTK